MTNCHALLHMYYLTCTIIKHHAKHIVSCLTSITIQISLVHIQEMGNMCSELCVFVQVRWEKYCFKSSRSLRINQALSPKNLWSVTQILRRSLFFIFSSRRYMETGSVSSYSRFGQPLLLTCSMKIT